MNVCRRVYYSGRVQGVGFRYTTTALAGGYAVGGQVRNLADGRVELIAEGDLDEVERFLDAVQRTMQVYIEAIEVHNETLHGFAEFRIER
jgi:acylphosphatase